MRDFEGLDKIFLEGKGELCGKLGQRDLKGYYNIVQRKFYLIRFLWFFRNYRFGRNLKQFYFKGYCILQ